MEKKRLAIFDFDKTITKVDSFNDFLKFTFGAKRFYRTIIKYGWVILLYKSGKKTNAYMKSAIFKDFFCGEKYENFKKQCNIYAEQRLEKIIRSDIKEKIKFYKENNFEMVILSASFKEWIEPWAFKNGFTKIVCSEFATKGNVIEGDITEKKSCYGKNKVALLKQKIGNIKSYNYIVAYGNSKSDMNFLELADEQFMVKRKEIKMLNEYAVISDGLWRKSLSAIRSTGKCGIKNIVIGDTILSTGMWSRYCTKRQKVTNIKDNQHEFYTGLMRSFKKCNKKPVLFPMEESTILWCSNNYEKIKDNCYVLLPPAESLRIALDKSLTMKKAMELKIACPNTFFPASADELKAIIKKKKMTDFVIKPYHGSGSAGLLYGDESQEIDLSEHWKKFGKMILQERIPSKGEGVGVCIIMDKNHEVKGSFAHKRLEQYPNSGGPSTQRIGIKEPRLVQESIKLLKSLEWIGVAMVEWKYDIVRKKYVLMEINPRFWGSLELPVRCGVNFPMLYYQLAKDRFVKEQNQYRTDLVCRWLIPGDILRYITKQNRERLGIFLRHALRDSEEWDKNDKMGFFANIFCQALLVLNPKYWKYLRK